MQFFEMVDYLGHGLSDGGEVVLYENDAWNPDEFLEKLTEIAGRDDSDEEQLESSWDMNDEPTAVLTGEQI
jgi:hypothetical protein